MPLASESPRLWNLPLFLSQEDSAFPDRGGLLAAPACRLFLQSIETSQATDMLWDMEPWQSG